MACLLDLVGILRADMYPTRWIVSILQKYTLDWKKKGMKKIENESTVVTAT